MNLPYDTTLYDNNNPAIFDAINACNDIDELKIVLRRNEPVYELNKRIDSDLKSKNQLHNNIFILLEQDNKKHLTNTRNIIACVQERLKVLNN